MKKIVLTLIVCSVLNTAMAQTKVGQRFIGGSGMLTLLVDDGVSGTVSIAPAFQKQLTENTARIIGFRTSISFMNANEGFSTELFYTKQKQWWKNSKWNLHMNKGGSVGYISFKNSDAMFAGTIGIGGGATYIISDKWQADANLNNVLYGTLAYNGNGSFMLSGGTNLSGFSVNSISLGLRYALKPRKKDIKTEL